VRDPIAADRADLSELTAFLRAADLTTVGLDSSDLHLWIDLDPDGRIIASTGFELVGTSVLLRSLAVAPSLRRGGRGTFLAQFALDRAIAFGATRAWLFSRRSGPFWQSLGFEPASKDELVTAVGSTQQVLAFTVTGQLDYEVAWTRALP
jgi:N-acetylglutamate synthase-like GNAT family acetyltransferase